MNIPNPNPDTRCTKPAHADKAKSIRRIPAMQEAVFDLCKVNKKGNHTKRVPIQKPTELQQPQL